MGLLSVVGLALPGATRAFSEPSSYLDDAANGGGGGRWFTGSPAEGYGCSVCHTGAIEQPVYPLHAEGFPTTGYVPGATYDLRLSWPEFAAHDQQVRKVMGAEPTSMAVNAEFVAESGIGSGVIEISRKEAVPSELCLFPPNAASSSIYQLAPGEVPAEVSRCEVNTVGERCVVTVKPCGAQELRLRWTAPPQREDAIWFSAGFVATDRLSGDPQSDSVAEITAPLLPLGVAAARGYESHLAGGCSVGGPGSGAGAQRLGYGWVLGLLLAFGVRGRRERRNLAHEAVVAGTLATLLIAGCDADPISDTSTARSPLVGLYTQGNRLGATTAAGAGAEPTSDAEIMGYFAVPPGDRCEGVMPDANAKGGTLSIEFKTVELRQLWGPANVGAVWIEDAAENYVKTLELWAGVRKKSLFKWARRACQKAEADVIAGATLPMPESHKVEWTGRDLKGNIVPDGLYKLYIEVTETETDIGRTAVYDVPKGTMTFMLQPPDAPPHQGLKVTYTPMQ